jgi:hypothetical protein
MSTTDPIDFVCVSDCVAEGCPSAGYMVNQVINCFIGALLGGQCMGMVSFNCLLNACMNQVASCLAQRCPPTQMQDGG